jgi:hypothetical protein
LRDGREDLGRRYPAGDERGDVAQRLLLVGEMAEFVAAFLSWARPPAFAIAVATSSVKPAMRHSVSAGKSPRRATAIAPHRRPPTTIGAATPDHWMPSRRTRSP